MHFGVDVSSNNPHPVNYQVVVNFLKALGGGAQPFVIVKVNEGTGYVNPDAVGDIAGFRAAGAQVAGYLMDHGSAAVTAEEALYRRVAATLPQTDDIELPDGLSPQAYAAHTAQLIAQDPAALVYLNQSEVSEGFPPGAGLWLADYNGVPGYTPYPVTHYRVPCGTRRLGKLDRHPGRAVCDVRGLHHPAVGPGTPVGLRRQRQFPVRLRRLRELHLRPWRGAVGVVTPPPHSPTGT